MKFLSAIIATVSSLFSQAQQIDDAAFHPDSLRAIVEVLASDSMQGRYTGSRGCADAAAFISKEFQKAGLLPVAGNNGFLMPVGQNWSNIVGLIPGKAKPGQLIIFSAHYDHVGTKSSNPFGLFNKKDKGKKTLSTTALMTMRPVCVPLSAWRNILQSWTMKERSCLLLSPAKNWVYWDLNFLHL
jgi:hypothetical protein